MTTRKKRRMPAMCLHRSSGRAYVRLNGRQIYLGPWDDPETEKVYRRVMAEHFANADLVQPQEVDLNYLALHYCRHCRDHYRDPRTGETGKEAGEIIRAVDALLHVYGEMGVDVFGPRQLKVLRSQWISQGLSRKYINKNIGRLKRMFKWGCSEGLVPAGTFHALQSVEGLRLGRSAAKETGEVPPVPWEQVEPVLDQVSPQVRAMILIGWHTGARPGEICLMRMKDIDTSGEVWIYRPEFHKTRHHGKDRVVMIGPKGQEVLRPWLRVGDRESFLFTPAEAEAWRLEQQRLNRKTKPCRSQASRKAKEKARRAKEGKARAFNDHYTTVSFRLAIHRGCDKAAVDKWTPNQLRHAFATTVAKKHGLVVAQVMLGHANPTTTAIYAARDEGVAIKVAAELG